MKITPKVFFDRLEALEKSISVKAIEDLNNRVSVLERKNSIVPYPVSEPKEECHCKRSREVDGVCKKCNGIVTPIKEEPYHQLRNKIVHFLVECESDKGDKIKTYGELADKILAIVKGE